MTVSQYLGPAEVEWYIAIEWAMNNNIQIGGTEEQDLEAINARREQYGLPPFQIVLQRTVRKEKFPNPMIACTTDEERVKARLKKRLERQEEIAKRQERMKANLEKKRAKAA